MFVPVALLLWFSPFGSRHLRPSRSCFKGRHSLLHIYTLLSRSASTMVALLTLFALPCVASSLSLQRADAEEGDMLFALSSDAEARQAGQRAEDEYTSVIALFSEAEALLREEVASDREAADEEIALLQEVDADEKVAEEEMEADSDPEASAAEAAPAGEAPSNATAAEAPASEAAAAESSEGTAAGASGNATEVQSDENQSRANLSTYFDPKLMAIFREKQAHLKETMKRTSWCRRRSSTWPSWPRIWR
ncbi:unnamed protein product [Prorocentrum cordatum]|uniref:Transmembrane protein n=1 Tax=Prorocentrum cordatum TaxID=2364126 RepID=A0ABN9Q7B9_9DINO|nr:unnamed protein product [Polarella glacialis]